GPAASDAQPQQPVAPAAPPAAPKEPLPVAEGPLDSGVVGHLAATVATKATQDVAELASAIEHEAHLEVEKAYATVDELESDANKAIDSTCAHTVGLLHSSTVYLDVEKKGNEGPRQVQIHTSLHAG